MHGLKNIAVMNNIDLLKQDLKNLFVKSTKTQIRSYAIKGFFILFTTLFLMEFRDYTRTQKLMGGIISKIVTLPNEGGEVGLVKNTLGAVYALSEPRTDFFRGDLNYSDDYLEAFFSGSGACGRYSQFACWVLTEMGYSCRMVQQRVNGTWGGHISLEANLNRFNEAMPARWMLVDPLFNHVFLDSQNRELSAESVIANWPQIIPQLPSDYPEKYNYQQGLRYTNWDKFGLFTRTIYRVGKFLHLPMDTFSYRAVFIKQHFWNLIIYGFGLVLTIFLGLRARQKK